MAAPGGTLGIGIFKKFTAVIPKIGWMISACCVATFVGACVCARTSSMAWGSSFRFAPVRVHARVNGGEDTTGARVVNQ